jgi:mitogen-activated protein kinase kinase kinase
MLKYPIQFQILMEYLGGASLNIHVTESRPLSVDIIKSYTEEILYGLEYLHNKDVVHKNLRVSKRNILIQDVIS